MDLKTAIFEYAAEYYGSTPEYLWAKYPHYAVLRRHDSRKWYGVVMDVSRERLGLLGSGNVNIIDLKCGFLLSGSLRTMPGFLPAYHMNKTAWISVLLDGVVALDEITKLLDLSYELAKK